MPFVPAIPTAIQTFLLPSRPTRKLPG
jgi:hypothetical protein